MTLSPENTQDLLSILFSRPLNIFYDTREISGILNLLSIKQCEHFLLNFINNCHHVSILPSSFTNEMLNLLNLDDKKLIRVFEILQDHLLYFFPLDQPLIQDVIEKITLKFSDEPHTITVITQGIDRALSLHQTINELFQQNVLMLSIESFIKSLIMNNTKELRENFTKLSICHFVHHESFFRQHTITTPTINSLNAYWMSRINDALIIIHENPVNDGADPASKRRNFCH